MKTTSAPCRHGSASIVRSGRHKPRCAAPAHCKPVRCRAVPSALEASQRLAAIRSDEHRRQHPRFLDPFAEALAETAAIQPDEAEQQATPDWYAEADAAATAHLDEQLLTAVDMVNMDFEQEYRQVVLLGCGMDTRPYRLPWPTGTLLFLLAPAEVHAAAEAALRAAGNAAVPRGCLLRRVPIDIQGETDFGVALEAAGYRGDRLSVWAVQGLTHLQLAMQQVGSLLAHVANMAALGSLVVGQLPPATADQASSWLAQAGLLGTSSNGSAPEGAPAGIQAAGRLQGDVAESASSSGQDGDEAVVPRLFSAQQQRLSLPQMRVYNEHTWAALEADEDFEGNFS